MSDKRDLPPPLNLEKPTRLRTAIPKCIYCDSTQEPLTDEHVMPFALGGQYIIEKGTCEVCRQKTKTFERICATEMFGAYRLSIGGPMYDRKKWPQTVPIVLRASDGAEEKLQIAWYERPVSIILPYYSPPGFLTGNPAAITELFTLIGGMENLPQEISESGKLIPVGRIHELALCGLLAKMAHGFAIVMLGGFTSDWEWPARRIVRGEMENG